MPAADLLFTGAAVFTGTGEPIHGHVVAVTEGRISAVVPEGEASALVGEHTRFERIDGALLSPGFQDAHVHPIGAGVELLMCNLTEATDADDAVAKVKAYADANPDETWIVGGGWSMDHFPGGAPVRTLLDAVVPDRPVLLMSRDHHSAWANTAAIALAGLDASTPDPADGRIEREQTASRPARSTRAPSTCSATCARRSPTTSPTPDCSARRRSSSRSASPDGRTPSSARPRRRQDVDVGLPPCARRGHPARPRRRRPVVGARRRSRPGRRDGRRRAEFAAPSAQPTLRARHDEDHGRRGRREPDRRDAHALSRLHGHDTDNSGLSFIDPTRLREIVTSLDAAGFQVHFHALGDRAVREALDAIEAARDVNGPTDGRHHLAHLQVIADDETARFAELDAVANMQALWATHEDQIDELTLPFLQDGAGGAPIPVRRSRAPWREARGGQRLAGLERRPDGRDPHRRQPGRARHRTPNRSAVPTSASTWRRRWLPTPPAPPM